MTAEATRLKYVRVGDQETETIPQGMGITGDENFIHMSWCLQCGQIQGKWPLARTSLEIPALPKLKFKL